MNEYERQRQKARLKHRLAVRRKLGKLSDETFRRVVEAASEGVVREEIEKEVRRRARGGGRS